MDRILVTGLYRSGTTLLQKILDMHPEINIIEGGVFPFFKSLDCLFLKYSDSNIIDRPLCIEPQISDQDYKDIFDKVNFNKSNIFELMTKIRMRIDKGSKTDYARMCPTSKWFDYLESIIHQGNSKKILEKIYESIHLYRGSRPVTYTGFKECLLDQFIEPLINCYKDRIKIVQLIRDPRAILASRNYGFFSDIRTEGKKHPLLLVAYMWRNSVRYKNILTVKYPDNFYSVKYESLINNNYGVVKDICKFLIVEFFPFLLDHNKFKDENGDSWKANTSFKQKSTGFLTASLIKWMKILPRDTLGAIEYLCAPEMLQAGYRPILSDEEQFACFVNYQEDTDTMKEWVKKFDLILDHRNKQREIARRATFDTTL